MQKKKTGKLFNFCLQAVAIIANKNQKDKKLLGQLGEEIGLLFQLADDSLILLVKKINGKTYQKRQEKRKIYFNQDYGLQKSIFICE